MDAVRTHHSVKLSIHTISEFKVDGWIQRMNRCQPVPQTNRVAGNCPAQDIDEIGSVYAKGLVPPGRVRPSRLRHRPPICAQVHTRAVRRRTCELDLIKQTEMVESALAIRGDRYARAHFSQLACLLEHRDLDTGNPRKRYRGSKPSQSPANYRDSGCMIGHWCSSNTIRDCVCLPCRGMT